MSLPPAPPQPRRGRLLFVTGEFPNPMHGGGGRFADFISDNIRLDPVILPEDTNLDHVLSYYMGKNTPERQEFIIENLRVELDIAEEQESERGRKGESET